MQINQFQKIWFDYPIGFYYADLGKRNSNIDVDARHDTQRKNFDTKINYDTNQVK